MKFDYKLILKMKQFQKDWSKLSIFGKHPFWKFPIYEIEKIQYRTF